MVSHHQNAATATMTTVKHDNVADSRKLVVSWAAGTKAGKTSQRCSKTLALMDDDLTVKVSNAKSGAAFKEMQESETTDHAATREEDAVSSALMKVAAPHALTVLHILDGYSRKTFNSSEATSIINNIYKKFEVSADVSMPDLLRAVDSLKGKAFSKSSNKWSVVRRDHEENFRRFDYKEVSRSNPLFVPSSSQSSSTDNNSTKGKFSWSNIFRRKHKTATGDMQALDSDTDFCSGPDSLNVGCTVGGPTIGCQKHLKTKEKVTTVIYNTGNHYWMGQMT